MYNELINDFAFKNTDEKIVAIIGYIHLIASSAESEYVKNRESNNFWKLPKIERKEVYKSVFNALLEVFGVVEKTFYTFSSKTED